MSVAIVMLFCAGFFLVGALYGFQLGRARARKPVRPANLSNLPEPDANAAVHEAGHAFVASRCTVIRVTQIRLEEKGGGGAVTTVSTQGAANLAWCQLVVDLAGVAAEAMVFGSKFRTGPATEDLLKARDRAEHIAALELKRPWDKDVPTISLAWRSMFVEPLSEQAEAVMSLAYSYARHILDRNRTQHYQLTSAVLAHRILNEALVEAYLPTQLFVLMRRAARCPGTFFA